MHTSLQSLCLCSLLPATPASLLADVNNLFKKQFPNTSLANANRIVCTEVHYTQTGSYIVSALLATNEHQVSVKHGRSDNPQVSE